MDIGRPKLYNDVKDLQKDIDKYFEYCDNNDKPYTLSGLAYFLDMDRKTLYNYSKDENFFPTIKKAREKVEMQLEENALLNKANPTFTIFNLKNNFGWKDKINYEDDKKEQELSKVEELLSKIENEANNDIK